MSGDGGYFWNGQQWVPVATPQRAVPSVKPKRTSPAWGIALIVGVFVIAVGVLALAVTAPARRAASPPAAAEPYNAPIASQPPTAPPPAQWWKEGMHLAAPGVAVGWAEDQGKRVKCPAYAGACIGVYVMTQTSCPGGVYVALSLLDDDGSVVGRANEIGGGMMPGDTAVVTVSWVPVGSRSARIAEVSCLG